jgi:hypothetical protein
MVRFGPAIGIIIVFVITLHAQGVRALHTLTPVRQGALKVRRYIGLICNSSHDNTIDAVTYGKTRRKPVCSM